MKDITPELIENAKGCASVEELAALAKEDGTELSAAEAKAYYDQLHSAGALADEELEDVSGGGCGSSSGAVTGADTGKCAYYRPARFLATCDCGSKKYTDGDMCCGKRCITCGKEYIVTRI